ncbi:unnamed protein product [Acanthosepion pharaonis]|uniref:Uncharacterized protein n=1 Tax=Acanthosepion pharaonis TaxID=158019 RepID=A0A812D957_ACAPH|nr:unnamed protein product [Sepia pharaonis]
MGRLSWRAQIGGQYPVRWGFQPGREHHHADGGSAWRHNRCRVALPRRIGETCANRVAGLALRDRLERDSCSAATSRIDSTPSAPTNSASCHPRRATIAGGQRDGDGVGQEQQQRTLNTVQLAVAILKPTTPAAASARWRSLRHHRHCRPGSAHRRPPRRRAARRVVEQRGGARPAISLVMVCTGDRVTNTTDQRDRDDRPRDQGRGGAAHLARVEGRDAETQPDDPGIINGDNSIAPMSTATEGINSPSSEIAADTTIRKA